SRHERTFASIESSGYESGTRSPPTTPARVVRRDADDNVEAGRQLADLRVLDRLEIDQHQLPVERVAQLAQHPVRAVLLVAVDEQLRGQQLALALLDADVDV